MKRRGLPIWLLRDVPAFLGVMFSFWPLMILVILNGRRAASGKKVRQSVYADFAIQVAHAEARLAFALWRQAYRRLGLNPRGVIYTLVPASDGWNDTVARYQTISRAIREMDAHVDAYVEDLRERYAISERDAANACSCPLRLASQSISPALFSSSNAKHWGNWHTLARDGGGSHSSRGPPLHPAQNQELPTSHARRARSRLLIRIQTNKHPPHFCRIGPRHRHIRPRRDRERLRANCVRLVEHPVGRAADHHIGTVSMDGIGPTSRA